MNTDELPAEGDKLEVLNDPDHWAYVRDVDTTGDEPLLLLRWHCNHQYPCERGLAKWSTYAGFSVAGS